MRAVVSPEQALAKQQLVATFTVGTSLLLSVSEDARPHGLYIAGTTAGCASYMPPIVLAETQSSIPRLTSRTFLHQGEPGLCHFPTAPGGTPCHSLLRQYDGCVLQESPRVGSMQPAFTESIVCMEHNEQRGGHAVTDQSFLRGVDAPPSNSSEDLEYLWEGGGRPLRLLFFKEQGCADPQLAQPPPLFFSPGSSDAPGLQENQGSPCGPTLEESALALRAVTAAEPASSLHCPYLGPVHIFKRP